MGWGREWGGGGGSGERGLIGNPVSGINPKTLRTEGKGKGERNH